MTNYTKLLYNEYIKDKIYFGGISLKKSINLNKKKAIIGGVVVIAIFMAVFFGIKIKNSMSNANEKAQVPEIYNVPEKEKIIIDGKVMPGKSKDFFAEPSKGEIENIAVEDGQKVDQGQVLFTYKNENISPEIDNLKEQLTTKEEELKVIQDETLKKTMEEEITKLNDKIKIIEDKSSYSVEAPFAGKVYISHQNSSENEPTLIMTLDSEDLYVKGQASEQDLSKINLNQEVQVMVNSTKEKVKGKVTFIGERPSVDKITSKKDSKQGLSYYDIKVNFLENQDLKNIKNGFHVQTTIEVLNNPIKVPYTALLQQDEKRFVYKVIDGIVYKQEVKTGETNNEFAVITEGVGEKDKIIKSANDKNIKEGENIYPSKENTMED